MTKEVLLKIQNGSTFDFEDYIGRFNSFYRNYFNQLIMFWKTFSKEINPEILIEFDKLYNEFYVMQDAFEKRAIGQNDLDFFEFAEYLSDVKQSLDLIKNLPKYLKTSSNFVDKFEEPVIEYIIRQGDTLESISKKFYGSSEFFGFIMDYNDIRYTDVNSNNWIGRKIKIPAKRIIQKDIDGIIDGLIGDNVLGKDIYSIFTFENDDIKTVDYEDCVIMSVENMLTKMEKGTIPEFPQVGNVTKNIIGKGFGGLSLSFIINDYESLFKLEPTIDYFSVTNIELKDDALYIDFTFKIINGYEVKTTLPVNLS